ncbi:alkaline-phosphatase-like protein [Mariannaea sp. PMI_226]|nr:alkaline-phosphatase-like protein [Mariannaea sp. PMI_226]
MIRKPRWLVPVASRLATRRFIFTLVALALCGAKAAYLHNHRFSVAPKRMFLFFFSFFTQDILLLLLIRLLLSHWLPSSPGKLRLFVTTITGWLVSYNVAISITSVSFYIVAGTEIHWRNIGFVADPASRAIILSGLMTFSVYDYPGKRFTKDDDDLGRGYLKYNAKVSLSSPFSRISSKPSRARRFLHVLPYIIISILLTALSTLTLLRPKDSSLIFLSWTSGLLPFVDFTSTSPFLDDLPSYFGNGIQRSWDNRSTFVQTTSYSWLPKHTPLAGFEDWYTNMTHYSATADPLKISNLNQPLRQVLRGKLEDISVRHVVIFFLESTRNDVFPIKKNGLIWNRFAETFPDRQLPQEAQDKLLTLTPTANFITGDYNDGFEHDGQKKRGGVRFTNAHTAGTYTLKSLTGTVCGVAPLVGDFNVEYSGGNRQGVGLEVVLFPSSNPQLRQPGQAHGSDGLSRRKHNRSRLSAQLGCKHGPVTLPNINEFAFEEDPLEDYIRDIFEDANKTNDRVFLTHLTSTSHHSFHLPAKDKYVPMAKGLDIMSRYINTEGYDDKWIRKVLNVLDEQGVANETLVIFLGDHGVSLPENNIASPYYNPNIGVDHVPLVISHPQLPAFDAHDAVHSSQILPTILDILLETESLNDVSRQAAMDLIRNYEGQSLLRPLSVVNEQTGQGQWQFTVTNPGRAMLTVRDARYPERHLVVPVIENVAWRLSDLTSDPQERNSIQNFDFVSFLKSIEEEYGRELAEWAEEGAFVTRWFVKENSKRWRFDHGA